MKDKNFINYNNNNEKSENPIKKRFYDTVNAGPDPIGYIPNPEDKDGAIPVMPIQPIIFKSDSSKENKIPENLFTAPLNSAGQYTFYIAKEEYEHYINTIGKEAYMFDDVQKRMTIDMCIEYIRRNTFENFCFMIDNVGPQLKSVINVVPLKSSVHEYLFGEKSFPVISRNISDVLYNFIFSNKYNHQFGFNNALENFDANMKEAIFISEDISIMQICQNIFTQLCYACDEAIKNTYLNVFDSPNYRNILANAAKACGIYQIDGTTPELIVNMISNSILSIINIMMGSVVCPSVKELFRGIAINTYFAFGSIGDCAVDNSKEMNNKCTDCNQENCGEDCPCNDANYPTIVHF